jgi:hypothetical protein
MSSAVRSAFRVLLGVGLCVAFTGTAAAREPVDLHGSPLGRNTGLWLLVADSVPFVLDVDRGAVARIRGLRVATVPGYSVLGVSESAAVVTDWGGVWGNKPQYLVRAGQATAVSLGSARDVVAAASGAGVWVTRIASPGRCRLQRIGLDGRKTLGRAIPCRWVTAPGGSLGLVVGRTRVIDPLTGRKMLAERQGIIGVAGDHVLVAGGPGYAPGYRFTLVDARTGSRRQFAWPSIAGSVGAPAIDPRGRYIALEFGDPSWHQTGRQVLDVWVYDTVTAKLTQLPSMPAYVSLKATSMQWTHDGRLVLLTQNDGRDYVAAWRPGQPTLPIKRVTLPQRTGGSNSFAPLR